MTWVAATRLALGIALAIPSTSCATSARDAPRISDSTTSVSSTYSRTLASGLGRPLPPQSDCVFPGSEELARLKATSTAIAEGTVGPSSTTTSSSKIEVVDFAVTKVLGTTSRPSHFHIVWSAPVTKSSPEILALSESYLIFLSASGDGTYYPSEGSAGVFELTDTGVIRHCPNYASPQSPLTASGVGEGESLAVFEGQISRS